MATRSGSSTEQEVPTRTKENGRNETTSSSKPASDSASTSKAEPKKPEPQQAITTKPSAASFWYQHVYLRIYASANVPFLSMAINLNLYALIFYCCRRNPYIKTLLIAYLLYCILDTTPRKGGYSWWSQENLEWARNVFFLKRFAAFFPVSMIKTAELDQNKGPYIFLYHPHGVIGIGACAALLSNACGFDKAFPGLRRRSATLNICFMVPFFREWILFLGFVSCGKQTLVNCLTKRGESICLLPGGAMEALYAQDGTFVCYLNRRKGFVKLALETNTKLVPCLGFGENGAFSSVTFHKKSWAALIQQTLTRWFTFSMPILSSPLPRANPIHVVIGPPVEFTSKDVDECHAQYVQALSDLYNQHKANYGHEDIPLEIH